MKLRGSYRHPWGANERLDVNLLAQVWEALSGVWRSISELEESAWSTAVPRRIRKSLDSVQETMRNFPNRVRQYEPFDYAQVIRIL